MEVHSPSQISEENVAVKETTKNIDDKTEIEDTENNTSPSNKVENVILSSNGVSSESDHKSVKSNLVESITVNNDDTPTEVVNGNGYVCDKVHANIEKVTENGSLTDKYLENGTSASMNENGYSISQGSSNTLNSVAYEIDKKLNGNCELSLSQNGNSNEKTVLADDVIKSSDNLETNDSSKEELDDCSDDIINASRALSEAADCILKICTNTPEKDLKEEEIDVKDIEEFEIPKSIEDLLEEDESQDQQNSESNETATATKSNHEDCSKTNNLSEIDVQKPKTSSSVVMKFVDETSQDNSDQEVANSKDGKSGQISLETMDSQLSEEDSDEDIDAGLEKCFSALDKKLEKEKESGGDCSINAEAEEVSSRKSSSDGESSKESVEATNHQSDVEGRGSDIDNEYSRTCVAESTEENEEEPMDLDKALGELEMIEKKTRKILDDDSESNKRSTTENSEEPATKKPKFDEIIIEDNAAKDLLKKKLKKELKKVTRVALEDIIATKMVEVMTNKSEIGQLRQQCDSFADTVEKWKRRAAALSKQCTDLSTVMRKYITDSKTRPRDKVAPVRITRSVGLQVMTPDQRRLQQHRQQLANRQAAARTAATAAASQSSNSSTPVSTPPVSRQVSPRPAVTRQVGGTTISPAKNSSQTTKQPAAVPQTNKPVIDVVDLSDDESAAPANKTTTTTTVVRQVANPVRGGLVQQTRPRVGYVPYRGVRPSGPRGGVLLQSRPPNRLPLKTQHPAPLPPMPNPQPNSPSWKLLPPRPALKISRVANGIVLSWNMNINVATHAGIASYQLYAYQESSHQRPDPQLWKKVGDVKALPLPMACTLTQFTRGNKYHFAVRAMDAHSRVGQFSEPNSIVLN